MNRGEAALRFLKSARLAVPPVEAVLLCISAERHSAAARLATEVRVIGARGACFEDPERVLQASLEAGCDGAWLGWGFASERASFVEALERGGLTVLAPRAETLALLGDKGRALEVAREVGFDTGGGVVISLDALGPSPQLDTLAQEASEQLRRALTQGHGLQGRALLLKATEGGGGRGITYLEREALQDEGALRGKLTEAIEATMRAEWPLRFVLEPLLEGALHIEAQLLGDGEGSAQVLGLRDCSAQRRRQKLIEECPPPSLPTEVATQLEALALTLAKRVCLRSAATLEALYEPRSGQLRFLEVNPRLQVEHPVTEEVYGVDLILAQLQIARGEGLPPLSSPRGVAIEARVYAEDPLRDCLPSPGVLRRYRPPSGVGVRVDTGFEEGDELTAHFDPLIAKVIAWAPTRALAVRRLASALDDLELLIEGGSSNHRYLASLLRSDRFVKGRWDTQTQHPVPPPSEHHHHIANVCAAIDSFLLEGDMSSINEGRHLQDGELPFEVYRLSAKRFFIHQRGAERGKGSAGLVELELVDGDTKRLTLAGETYHIQRILGDERYWVNGSPHLLPPSSSGPLRAPSMGTVLSQEARVGSSVQRGALLLTLESMKVEVRVEAPRAGVVRDLHVSIGEIVRPGQPLLTLHAQEGQEEPSVRPSLALWREEDQTHVSLSLYQAACCGWDLPPSTLSERRDVRCPAELSERYLEAFCDLAELFDRRPRRRSEDQDGASLATRPQLLISALLERRDGDEREVLPSMWRSLLLRALERLGVNSLRPSHELNEALQRLKRAQESVVERAIVAQRILERLERPSRGLLDRLLGLDPDRFSSLMSLANARALEALSHRRSVVTDKAIQVALDQACDPVTPLWKVAVSHHRLIERLLPRVLEGDERSALGYLRLVGLTQAPHHVRVEGDEREPERWVSSADLQVCFSCRPPWEGAESAPSPELRRLAWLATSSARFDQTLATLQGHEHEHDQRSPPSIFKRYPALEELWLLDAHQPFSRAQRVTCEPSQKTHSRDQNVVNISPAALKRLQLERFARFSIKQVPPPQYIGGTTLADPLSASVALFQLTAHENAQDVRLIAYAEVGELKRGRGRPLSIPEVDRVFFEATRALQGALAELDPQRRLHWNRLIIHILPVVPLGVDVIKRYVTRLSPRARWVGLEKVVVQARFRDPRAPSGVTPLMDLSIAELIQPQQSYALRPSSAQPISPRSPFESSVVSARRRGLIHPKDVIYLLEGGGALSRGKVHPLPRRATASLVTQTTLQAYLIETPNLRPKLMMSRVLLISDPTLRMGALSVPECELLIEAFDYAEERQLPVEWVSVSSGARIDWESGTENLDACAQVLKRIIRFNEAGGQVNVIVPGVCVGAQSYWNAEATMMMSARGLLIMTDRGAMVLTGKRALELSGCASALDELEIGGFSAVMGANGQGQLHAPDLPSAYQLLYRFYQLTYRPPGAYVPPPLKTKDLPDRDLSKSPYPAELGHGFKRLGELFSEQNRERKRPFSVRPVMEALLDQGAPLIERWGALQGAEIAVVYSGRLAGNAVTLIGIDNQAVARISSATEGPRQWSGGTLYPQASRKVARAINASRGSLPVIVLANLSGFDGSPESLRNWQLEYGAEIARAVVAFDRPIYFVVLSRYHGGAYVVFSKRLNPRLQVIALEGSYASVIGGGPAASIVFGREVNALATQRGGGAEAQRDAHAEVAQRFDQTHDIHRAQRVGSIDVVLPLSKLRAHLASALSEGTS